MKNALVPLANGFEEIEAMTVIDILRRAGIDVVIAGIPGKIVRGSHAVIISTDTKIDDVENDIFDAIILPGGNPGYKNLSKSNIVLKQIVKHNDNKRLVAAICASPLVLAQAGVLYDKIATVYPGMERDIPKPRNGSVIKDGNIITAQGPGVALNFALAIVEYLLGKAKIGELRKTLVMRD